MPRPEGWELGTWSDDWRSKLALFPPFEWFLPTSSALGRISVHLTRPDLRTCAPGAAR